jgi:epoxyqueuosine reductase
MLGFNYAAPGSTSPAPQANHGRVARYAQGPDYHPLLWARLRELADWFHATVPGHDVRGVCDTAPLLERDFARRAGLGWVGKNTMLIHPKYGSYFFLAAILTSAELPPSAAFDTKHCGTCTACLEACPTSAFPKPGVLDATRCISYFTIEHHGPSPAELRPQFQDWLFGCDVCQEVCPWNTKPPRQRLVLSDFPHDDQFMQLDAISVLKQTEAEFRQRFRGTALWRAKWSGLRRNAAIVLGNTGTIAAMPALEAAMNDTDDLVAEAACWAVELLRQRHSPGRSA